jgi:hypothetical protein
MALRMCQVTAVRAFSRYVPYRRNQLRLAAARTGVVGGPSGLIQFPVSSRRVVWRVQDWLLKKARGPSAMFSFWWVPVKKNTKRPVAQPRVGAHSQEQLLL